MRSLFVRIFVSFWLAMTLIGGAFAIIYATTFPESRVERYRYHVAQTMRMFGAHALEALERGDRAAAEALARDHHERSGPVTWIFREGAVIFGADPPAKVQAVGRVDAPVRHTDDQEHVFAEPLGRGVVVVGTIARRSRLLKYISPDTLPLRLLVIFLISGLICFFLARYLTRRVNLLRTTTQTLAAGDLSVRVGSRLGAGRDEVTALGRDIDRMAERIEQLLEARQRLLRDISHELRSPLARLTVALELARRRAGDGARASLDRIEREAERLGELIGEVLALTRLDEGAPVPERTAVDLTALVEAVVHDADFEGGASASVVLDAPAPIEVAGVEELLRRAIENVVRNAVRFTAEGTRVEVTVRAEGDRAVVRVRDHGDGVPEESLAQIFTPFYRVGTARERGAGGTGLGLAITARAVRMHGGDVEARNHADGGLEVLLAIPLRR